jgi:ribose transport system ATP-binding protein
MPVLGRFARAGIIDQDAATNAAADVMQRVQVDKRALYTAAGAFSGGNQQKIVLAKWLVTQTKVLLLFDPSRGVDVGTKREIYLLMRAYVDAGGAVLFYSTEIPELANLCDRVMVMYRGRVAREMVRGHEPIDERNIVEAALGHTTLPSAAAPVAPPAIEAQRIPA